MKPGLATFWQRLLPPADGEMRIRLLDMSATVFDRVGQELVQGHREGLDCSGAQRNAFRSAERYPPFSSGRSALRDQFGIDKFVEGDPAASLRTKEKPLRPA
jgi:hypothetical protein